MLKLGRTPPDSFHTTNGKGPNPMTNPTQIEPMPKCCRDHGGRIRKANVQCPKHRAESQAKGEIVTLWDHIAAAGEQWIKDHPEDGPNGPKAA